MNLFSETEPQYTEPTKSALPIGSLFSKFNDLKVKSDGTLFGIDARIAVTQCKCPFCFCNLYLMRNGKMYYCKSKKHRNRFVISASKVIHS
jgi:hypothetical protein